MTPWRVLPKMKTKKSQSRTKRKDFSPFYKELLTEVELYTDGSASHTNKHGGWAYILTFPDGFEIVRSGHQANTTNNAMELRAAVEGMKFFKSPKRIKLYSDSAYMVNALLLGWWKEWEKNNFLRRDGTPTPNKELWQELVALSRFHLIEPIKVKGHNGDANNERCDKLAKQARKAGQAGVSVEEIRPVNRISKRQSRPITLAEKRRQGRLKLDWQSER